MMTLRETIRALTARHLDDGHLVAGQNLTAVGWCGGTLPERQDMTELPNSDVADAGFAVGMALAGRLPIYILRYQGFNWFAQALANYAAKSMELWRRPCKMLVRTIAMEGGIGPTTSGSHHSIFYRMPGMKLFAPMTPGEWEEAYWAFREGEDPVIVSEHRAAWDNDGPYVRRWDDRPDVVLFPISITRAAATQAALAFEAGLVNVSVCHLWRLKPLEVPPGGLEALARCGHGIVIDDDYPDGIAKAIAHDLSEMTGARVLAMGLAPRTAGFAAWNDNLPPDAAAIARAVRGLLKE